MRALTMTVALASCLLAGRTAPAADADKPAERPKVENRWHIKPGAVGIIQLGKPMPPQLLTRDLESRYVAQYVADAQPIEGFRYNDPPVTIGITKGPFVAWDAKHGPSEPPVDRLRKKGAKAARGPARVNLIWVNAPGPATEAGIGVGSTIEAMRAAYPDLSITRIPENGCVALVKSLPGVSFRLDPCNKGATGQVVKRVDLWMLQDG